MLQGMFAHHTPCAYSIILAAMKPAVVVLLPGLLQLVHCSLFMLLFAASTHPLLNPPPSAPLPTVLMPRYRDPNAPPQSRRRGAAAAAEPVVEEKPATTTQAKITDMVTPQPPPPPQSQPQPQPPPPDAAAPPPTSAPAPTPPPAPVVQNAASLAPHVSTPTPRPASSGQHFDPIRSANIISSTAPPASPLNVTIASARNSPSITRYVLYPPYHLISSILSFFIRACQIYCALSGSAHAQYDLAARPYQTLQNSSYITLLYTDSPP